ncbi:hypothetical protein IFM89_036256 [Coptis chinensis]|uniref:Uncharacterized protein n=1 Tax=Coptis chinensis TaxID=261450 RepID=A0A835HHM9_9MAGN|nr:hypothetical protein IFM89_036256 [Coptis chinensis]
MRGKYFNKAGEIMKKSSPLWSGMKEALKLIEDHSTWVVGNGKSIHLWKDRWAGEKSLAKPSEARGIHHIGTIFSGLPEYTQDQLHWGGRFYRKAPTMTEACYPEGSNWHLGVVYVKIALKHFLTYSSLAQSLEGCGN